MILNKVKVALAVGFAIQVVAYFVPDLPMGEREQAAIVAAIMLIVQLYAFWKTRERQKNVDTLDLK